MEDTQPDRPSQAPAAFNSPNQPVIEPQLTPQSPPQIFTQAPQNKPKKTKAILTTSVSIGLLVVLGIIGWKIESKNTINKSGNQNVAANSAALSPYDKCLKDYKDANLCHYYANSLNPKTSGPFTSTNVANLAGRQIITTTESDGNGNTKITQPGLTAIEVNGTDYIQNGSGPWLKQSSKQKTEINTTEAANTFGIEGTNGSHATFKSEGTIVCGAVTCNKYQVINCCSVPTTEWFSFDARTYKLIEYYTSSSITSSDTTYVYGPIPPITIPADVAG